MSSLKSHWLTLLSSELAFSESFTEALNTKLVDHARLLASVNLSNGAFGFVPLDSGFEIQYKQLSQFHVGSVSGYLIGPDGRGHEATAIWYCSNHVDEAIEPTAALPNDYQIEAYWADFPIDEMREYTRQTVPPVEVPSNLGFEVEWKAFSLPDVSIELQAKDNYTEDQVQKIEAAIDQTILEWNGKPGEVGRIHYGGKIDRIAGSKLKIHIDFGSAGSAVFLLLLQKLQRIEIPSFIQKIIFA